MIDQFTVEPTTSHTGSYTDDVIVGNQRSTEESLLRRVVGSKVSGINNSAFAKQNLLFNQRLQLISGSKRGLGSGIQNLFNQGFSSEEKYFDSFAPNTIEILQKNGSEFPADFGSPISGSERFNIPSIDPDRTYVDVIFGDGRDVGIFIKINPGTLDFLNRDWAQAPFAFRSKYKELNRVLQPTFRLNQPIEMDEDILGFPATPVTASEIGGFFVFSSTDFDTGIPVFCVAKVSGSTSFTKFKHIDNDFRGLEATGHVIYVVGPDQPITSSDTSGRYVMINDPGSGNNRGLYTSVDGYNWDVVISEFKTFDVRGGDTDTDITGSFASIPSGIAFRKISHSVNTRTLPTQDDFHSYVIAASEGVCSRFGSGSKVPSREDWDILTLSDLDSQSGGVWDGGNTSHIVRSVAFSDPYGTLSEAQGRFCIVGTNGTTNNEYGILVSTNRTGSNYTAPSGVPASSGVTTLNDICHNGAFSGRFITVGNDGLCLTSDTVDGAGAWTVRTTGVSADLVAVAAETNGTTVIAAGSSGTIIRSTDSGNTWSTISNATGTFTTWVSVTFVKRSDSSVDWIIGGLDGEIQISSNNGATWTLLGEVEDSVTSSEFTVRGNSFVASAIDPNADPSGHVDCPVIVCAGNNSRNSQAGFTALRICDLEFESDSNDVNLAAYLPHKNSQIGLENPPVFASNSFSPPTVVRPSLETYNKVFYGFGEGFEVNTVFQSSLIGRGTMPSFEHIVSTAGFPGTANAPTLTEQYRLFGPIIRGWNYGLLSGIPTRTKCVFRKNRFGQLRDMLEQRLFGKMLVTTEDGRTSVSDSPVTVRFTSGTLAFTRAQTYLTATNPDFNPTDSGEFDFESKVGQPFFDDVDLTQFR